ncbi:MAG: tRNA pseudouridine(38-40) synthase TruA [Verrucomicrobia bacterium]|nr:tRNA pseudouridine(38-40) synthase TruA [Verrucomicrobiota bacterium]
MIQTSCVPLAYRPFFSASSAQVKHQNFKLTLAYRGEDFYGWQRQDPHPTVQLALETALKQIFGKPFHVAGSGRTDRGVHAIGQVASVQLPPTHSSVVLLRALNFHLPPGVRVVSVHPAKSKFHARFSARGKTYLYRIVNAPFLHPMEIGRAWHVPRPLDLKAVRQAARLFVGKHDFASFTSNPGYERESTVRRLRAIRITRKSGSVLEITFDGDGFLYRMVRNLVGALVKVGHGRLSVADLKKILSARSRSTAPPTAPAEGLYLLKVRY